MSCEFTGLERGFPAQTVLSSNLLVVGTKKEHRR